MPKRIDEAAATEKIQPAIESLVKNHGFDAVRRVWTRYANTMKEREKLEQQRADAEQRLKELDAKIRKD